MIGLGSPRITSTSVEVCRDTITPCLMFDVRVEGINAGTEVYIPIDGRLYSDDGKLLAQVDLEYAAFSSAGAISTSAIIVDYLEKYPSGLQHVLNLRCKTFLDPKSINYIEERRRINKYRRVELKLKLRFLRLHSMVYHYNYVYRVGKDFPSILRLPNDAVMLKAGEPLLLVDTTVYNELETLIVIDGPRWVKDFLPALGLGNYILLELPLPKLPSAPEEALQHFVNAIKSLERAKEAVYETLDIGPPLTALRNALIEVCNALKPLGLATETQNRGCTLVEEKLIELFQSNRELAKLVMEIFTNAKRIATRGPEPTQPHLAPGPAPTLYQVESLIGPVVHMLKLITDTLRHQHV